MKSICGAKCDECILYNNKCKGCTESKGCPFGKKCWIANYIEIGGFKKYQEFKKELIDEFNSLKIDGLPTINELYELHGSFINLNYTLPSGEKVKLLNDDEAYIGNQVESVYSKEKYYGIIANMSFLLVSEYNKDLSNAEIIIYKRR